ncbi:MAG: thermonuclease family protein [Deltaproteobacteria bacterium]|nr:thermonuclease family protein [Deltaproteobacteria bacterium]
MAKTTNAELVLSKRSYNRLLADLRQLLEEGKARAEAALGRELVRTYHGLGQRIIAEELTERAGYGSGILRELGDELNLNLRVLQRAMLFARLYPEVPTEHMGLRWAHYRELVRVKDDDVRAWYEAQTATSEWTVRQLVDAIHHDAHAQACLVAPGATGKSKALPRPQEATYVYKATVERVIDGDTLLLVIDLGFHVLKRQRVRLARLDTPPLGEKAGRDARDFVRDTLAKVPFVVVKTNKVDLYGRYVGHIFYAPGVENEQRVFSKGRHLNAELVRKGFAQPM